MFLADMFVSAHIQAKGPKSAIRVMVSHNLPVKWPSYPKHHFVEYDVHFLSGFIAREMVELTIEKHKLDNSKIRLLNIGHCKSDTLLNSDYNREQILQEIGLDPNKETVLYSPSWDKGLSLSMFGESIVEEIVKNNKINLIVKLHPVSYTPQNHPQYEFYTGGIDWAKKLSKYEKYSNFKHIISIDNINPLLEASDVMVTDLSSVALEFILIDKPVIYFDCPSFFNDTLKRIYSEFGSTAECVKNHPSTNAGRNVGVIIKNASELTHAIQRSLDVPNEYSKERKNLSKQLLYNQGNASVAGANSILELLQL